MKGAFLSCGKEKDVVQHIEYGSGIITDINWFDTPVGVKFESGNIMRFKFNDLDLYFGSFENKPRPKNLVPIHESRYKTISYIKTMCEYERITGNKMKYGGNFG